MKLLEKIKSKFKIKGLNMKIDDNSFWVLFWSVLVIWWHLDNYFDLKKEELNQSYQLRLIEMNLNKSQVDDIINNYEVSEVKVNNEKND